MEYAAKDTWIDELEMLHRRCPMGVFSHDEAFYYYGLTDREPLVHTLTIYSGYNVHRLKEDGYKVYTVGGVEVCKARFYPETGVKEEHFVLELSPIRLKGWQE